MKDRWIKVVERRGQSILISSYFYNGIQTKYFRKVLGLASGLDHYLIVDYKNYYLQSEVERFQRLVTSEFKGGDPKFLRQTLDRLSSKGQELISFSRYIESLSPEMLLSKIATLFAKFSQYCLEFGPAMYWPILVEPLVENAVRQIIGEHIPRNGFHYFEFITRPHRPTEGTYELISLLEIARRYYTGINKQKLNRFIDFHLKKFGWLSFTKFVGQSWTRADIISRIEKIPRTSVTPQLRRLRGEYRVHWSETKKIFRNFNFSKQEQRYIELVQELTYFRTWRIDVYTQAGYAVKNLFSTIAPRLGLSVRELMFLTYKEIERYLRKRRRFPRQIVRKRVCGKWQLLFANGGMSFSYKNFIEDDAQFTSANVITGQVASPGHVRGEVRVIRGVLEFNKMRLGAVLVTSMTTPDFVPLMQQSSAIITDEGGITSHAAIVARELKKPCIIGTKIATKIFKDGDRVEVDAEKGIVRKT